MTKVEVRVDDGEGGAEQWQEARLGPDAGSVYWRQWFLPWDATPGTYSLAVRATNTRGETQTAERATPFPAGSTRLAEAIRRLDAAGLEITDVTLRRPTLDDVFLKLTGHAAESAPDGSENEEAAA